MSQPLPISPNGQRAITLVLGDGGARGVAHLGVFRALEEARIPIGAFVGNSAGALAAVMYQQCGGAENAGRRLLGYFASPQFQRLKLEFRISKKGSPGPPNVLSRLLSGWRRQVAMHLLFRRSSLFHSRRLAGVLEALVDEGRIEDLPLPTKIVALDLVTGEEVLLDRGSLGRAMLATCSVAGFFPPVRLDGRTLIDSGQSNNLPVQVGRMLGDPVVAVDLSHEIEEHEDFATGIEVMFRSEEIGSRWNTRLRSREADVHLTPRLGGRYWLDFTEPEAMILAGEEAAREVLPRIEALVRGALRPADTSFRPST